MQQECNYDLYFAKPNSMSLKIYKIMTLDIKRCNKKFRNQKELYSILLVCKHKSCGGHEHEHEQICICESAPQLQETY